MRIQALFVFIALAAVTATAVGQVTSPNPSDTRTRRFRRPAPVRSPEVSEGRNVTFRLRAPNADLFAWVGGFSSAVPSEESVADALAGPDNANGKLKLLWVGCGKDDFLLQRNQEFIARLKEKGIHHEWHLTEGNHSWPIWRSYLAEFAPKLFQ